MGIPNWRGGEVGRAIIKMRRGDINLPNLLSARERRKQKGAPGLCTVYVNGERKKKGKKLFGKTKNEDRWVAVAGW